MRSEYNLRNKIKQRGFEDEARKRIRHSDAQCKNDQRVLGIVPGLNRVIPVVEHLNEWTNKADRQNNRHNGALESESHPTEYITAQKSNLGICEPTNRHLC